DPTPALVHDLDIRITQGNTIFYPWKLQANANNFAIRSGDNFVDTVESIKIDNANGEDYMITITHKDFLQTERQDFSLIISGVDSNFGFESLGYSQTVCSNSEASFSFVFNNNGIGNVNLSAIDV